MKKSHAPHRGYFLLFFAILVNFRVPRAQAQTIVPELTGTTTVFSFGFGAYQCSQSIEGLEGQFVSNLAVVLSFNGSTSNCAIAQQCQYFPNTFVCTDQWSGTYSGGSVSLFTVGVPDIHATGTINPGGSFSGEETCALDHPCVFTQQAMFDFTSTWTNGWRSDGTLLVFSDGAGNDGILNMTTVTPEPGSMMLVGLGIAAIGTFIRRRSG